MPQEVFERWMLTRRSLGGGCERCSGFEMSPEQALLVIFLCLLPKAESQREQLGGLRAFTLLLSVLHRRAARVEGEFEGRVLQNNVISYMHFPLCHLDPRGWRVRRQ